MKAFLRVFILLLFSLLIVKMVEILIFGPDIDKLATLEGRLVFLGSIIFASTLVSLVITLLEKKGIIKFYKNK